MQVSHGQHSDSVSTAGHCTCRVTFSAGRARLLAASQPEMSFSAVCYAPWWQPACPLESWTRVPELADWYLWAKEQLGRLSTPYLMSSLSLLIDSGR